MAQAKSKLTPPENQVSRRAVLAAPIAVAVSAGAAASLTIGERMLRLSPENQQVAVAELDALIAEQIEEHKAALFRLYSTSVPEGAVLTNVMINMRGDGSSIETKTARSDGKPSGGYPFYSSTSDGEWTLHLSDAKSLPVEAKAMVAA